MVTSLDSALRSSEIPQADLHSIRGIHACAGNAPVGNAPAGTCSLSRPQSSSEQIGETQNETLRRSQDSRRNVAALEKVASNGEAANQSADQRLRLSNSLGAGLITTGLVAACLMLVFELTKQWPHLSMTIRASQLIALGFTIVGIALSSVVAERGANSRRAMDAEVEQRRGSGGESRCETSAQGQVEIGFPQDEDLMRAAIEAARIGFLRWDVTHDKQEWSATAKRLLGLSPESPADFTVLMDTVHREDRESLRRLITSVTPQKPEFSHEHRACWRDGTVHWIWIKGWGFFDEGGSLLTISGIAMDIDERKQAEDRLRLQATALEQAANAIVLTDEKGAILWVNPAFTQMTGYRADEVIGRNPKLLQSGKQDAAFYGALWNTIAAGSHWRGEIINRKKDGTLYTEDMTIAPVRSTSGPISHYVAIKQDVSQRRLAEQALQNAQQKYRSIFDNAILGIFQTTPDGEFLAVNPALARMAGYESPEEFLNSVHCTAELYVDFNRRDELRELIKSQKVVRAFEVDFRCKDGSTRTTSLDIGAMADGKDGSFYLEGTVQDITQRKAAEARIQFLAYHDALTGLPNRALFEDRLAKALGNARRRGESVAVLWLDLDNFKTINDSLGHSVGDSLLKQIGERLHKHARAQDTVAKVGGDEFVFALINPGNISRVTATAERIRRQVAGEFEVQGHVLNVTCSIGISLFPDHGADCEALVKNADVAMYSAKKYGRNNYRFFTAELNDMAAERLVLESGLRVAIENREFFLQYQPQVDMATGRITGAEALLRWRHPVLGLVGPDKFIPIAEESGLIVAIGEWVLTSACAQARNWQDQGLPTMHIAVNVSALQLHHQRFLHVVRRVLRETGLAPKYLELEITESVLFANAGQVLSKLHQLTELGLRLSIDDFGTGFSSLSYLKDLPVFRLKIDHSFIKTLTVDPRDAAITASIISMGHSLDLNVLAEGVETEAQMSFLRAHHCDGIQGYFFSKPLEADDFAKKVRGMSLSQLEALASVPEPCTGALESQSPSRQITEAIA